MYYVLEMFSTLVRLPRGQSGRRRHVSFSIPFSFSIPWHRAVFEFFWPARAGGADRGCDRRDGVGAGSSAERPGRVRFLRAVAVMVALLLRGGIRARQRRARAGAMRRAAVLLRGPRVMAAIRARLSRLLPAAVAAAGSQYHGVDAGSDAGARADLFRMGQTWHLFGTGRAGLFRDHPQGALGRENTRRMTPMVGAQDRCAGRDRGRLHQGQSRSKRRLDRGDLRQPAAQRSPDLHEQGSASPRLLRNRSPRLPQRAGGDAADAGWLTSLRDG